MHDFQRATAEALPELLKKLKEGGYKVVQIVGKTPVEPLPEYKKIVLKEMGGGLANAQADVERDQDHQRPGHQLTGRPQAIERDRSRGCPARPFLYGPRPRRRDSAPCDHGWGGVRGRRRSKMTGGPLPAIASHWRKPRSKCRKQRTTSNYLISVSRIRSPLYSAACS